MLLAAGDPEADDAAEPAASGGRPRRARGAPPGPGRTPRSPPGGRPGTRRPARRCRSAGPSARRASSGRAAPARRRTGRPPHPWRSGGRRSARRARGRAPPARRRPRRSGRRSTWSWSARTTSAPRVSGCWRYGDAKVLSTTSSAPGVVGDPGEGLDVADVEQRVGRRLDPDQLRLARAGSPRGRRPGRTTGAGSCTSPQACSTLSKSRNVPPYASSGSTTWSPGRHSARTRVSSAASPLAKAKPRSPSSSAARLLLQRGAGRVGRAAVLVAAAQPAHAVLLVGGGGVDRRDHRAGHRVGLVARVDGPGLESRLVPMLLFAHPGETSPPVAVPATRRASRGQLVVEGDAVRAVGVDGERTGADQAGQCAGPASGHDDEELVQALTVTERGG